MLYCDIELLAGLISIEHAKKTPTREIKNRTRFRKPGKFSFR